jgi:hypothetical protein
MNLIDRVFKPSGNTAYSAWRTSLLILTTTAIFLCGCADQVQKLQAEQIKKLQEENDSLGRQIETLSVLGPEIRLEAMSVPEKIKLKSRSGFYDKNRDGKKEVLKVYVQPIDPAGDKIKAPGSVRVRLWDLNADADAGLLKEWQIEPEELKQMWVGTLLTHYYRLSFDVSDMPGGRDRELKLDVSFTDYVTGKVFEEYKMIKP